MLCQVCSPEQLARVLVPRDQYHPFPTAQERPAWESLPAAARQAHVSRGERALAAAWPPLPATLFLDFARTGNRARYQDVRDRRRAQLADLVIAECVEGHRRFVEAIADAVWSTCEETYWGVPAHLNMQRAGVGLPDAFEPTVDLFVGETVSLLAWTLYLLGPALDRVSPLLRQRLVGEAQRRVLEPCLQRDDFWWMGFSGRRVNNWNPWVNSNWLTAALLLESDEGRRQRAVARCMRSLDHFVDPYPADGGCDEGPGYWGRAGASLFDCLELLHGATGGAIDVYGRPLIQEMGRYIYRVQIAGRYFVNFADAPALVTPNGALVYLYGKRIGDERMMALGAWSARQQQLATRGAADSLGRLLPALFALDELEAREPIQPLPRDVWFPHIEVMAARDREGSDQGLYVAVKGGHNAESHNHNDVGHFIAYVDGCPVIVDVGVEEYTAKTFSARRYEIWTMQSAYHSLPSIGGVMQAAGGLHRARDVQYQADDASAWLRLDMAPAYPAEARLGRWERTVVLRRGESVQVDDRFRLEGEARGVDLYLVTACLPVVAGPGEIDLQRRPLAGERSSGQARLRYPDDQLAASVEQVVVEDRRLTGIWGEQLHRIRLCTRGPVTEGSWTLRLTR